MAALSTAGNSGSSRCRDYGVLPCRPQLEAAWASGIAGVGRAVGCGRGGGGKLRHTDPHPPCGAELWGQTVLGCGERPPGVSMGEHPLPQHLYPPPPGVFIGEYPPPSIFWGEYPPLSIFIGWGSPPHNLPSASFGGEKSPTLSIVMGQYPLLTVFLGEYPTPQQHFSVKSSLPPPSIFMEEYPPPPIYFLE